jgi:dethiobiotin synthetase
VTLVVVTGTGTDVGKTFVTGALARVLSAAAIEVHARKPVQSFTPGDTNTDADTLAAATGEPADNVCPPHRRYPTPMAPPMAAAALGQPAFSLDQLADELAAPATGITFVEGAGGVLSPLADDGDTRGLIATIEPALTILVADAGLGTINLVRMSIDALGELTTTITFLNRFDATNDLHVRNAEWLRTREGLEIVTDLEALVTRVQTLAR